MKFTNKTVLYFTEKFYPHIGTIYSVKPLFSRENSLLFKIITSKGQYVFHHNTNDKKSRIEKMCNLLNYISKNDSIIIQFIKNKTNEFSKNQCYLTKFEIGNTFAKNKNQYLNLAKKLSLLHRTLSKSKISYSFSPNQKFYSLLKPEEILFIKKKIRSSSSKHEFLIKQNFSMIENEIKNISAFVAKTYLDKQLIHFDIHPGNVLFKNNAIVFLDFNSMRNGYVIEDVVFSGFRFAYQINSHPKHISQLLLSFIKTYDKKIIIDEKELKVFLIRCILYRICFILKKHFFQLSDSWISDLEQQLKFLKLAKNTFN